MRLVIIFNKLHALGLTTGSEEFGGPVEIIATYPGTGSNSSNGNVVFDPQHYFERAGLALSNGVIYDHLDIPWRLPALHELGNRIRRAHPRAVRVPNLTHNGHQGAIWQSGGAPAIDSNGFLYAMLGNGAFDTTLDTNGFPSQGNYGNCFVKLSAASSALSVADYWTMFNTVDQSNTDTDLGSGGPMLLPDMTDAGGVVRHLAVGSGKDAHIYVADRDNMGKFNPSSNVNLYQDLTGSLGGFNFSTPAFFNGLLYFGSVGDVLRGFSFTNARMNSVAVTRSLNTFGFPGTSPTISANGTTSGVLWAAENVDPAVLHAYDAGDLSHELYNTNQASNSGITLARTQSLGCLLLQMGKCMWPARTVQSGAFGLLTLRV